MTVVVGPCHRHRPAQGHGQAVDLAALGQRLLMAEDHAPRPGPGPPQPAQDRDEIVVALCDMFEAIDINGDRTIDWDELSEKCVEDGLAAAGGATPRGAKSWRTVRSVNAARRREWARRRWRDAWGEELIIS